MDPNAKRGCLMVFGAFVAIIAFIFGRAAILDARLRADVGVETFRAVDAVIEYNYGPGIAHYKTAPIGGGTGVLVKDMAAYWVKDGEVFHANGHAKAWSPSTRQAPVGIGMSEIEAAIAARD